MKKKHRPSLAATVLISMSLTVCAATAEWKPVAQPGLAAALESAPELKFEELADGPESCWEGPIWWVPNPDGKSYDMVFSYYPSYTGPNQVFIYDTATKLLKKSSCPELSTVNFGFHLNHFYMVNGKAYIFSGQGPVCYFVYDPANDEFQFGGYPFGSSDSDSAVFGREGLATVNDNGTLIGGFGPLTTKRKQAAFYTIDPATGKGDFLGTVGPENPNAAWEYRRIIMDGDWIYASLGHSPWRLYGMNVKTRQGKVLAETERFMGDRNIIRFLSNSHYPGVYVSITGLKGGPQDKTQAFWLRNGELTPCEPVGNNVTPTPPWLSDKLAQPRINYTGAFDENDPPPKGMDVFRGAIDLEGKARCWYRFRDSAMAQAAGMTTGAWQRIDLPAVKFVPSTIRRMVPLPDGSLFALTEGYGRAVTYNPKTRQRTPLGSTMSVYSLMGYNDKLYLCGYPGSILWVYDPTKPWSAGQSLEMPPETVTKTLKTATRDTNPAHVTSLKEFTEVHMPMAMTIGGDGCIYVGGKVVRIGNGGGLGWWDTRTNKAGGLHEPFDSYPIFWMCSAANGRYILCSTKTAPSKNNPDYTPPRGRLFVYDTTKKQIIHTFEDERLFMPGYITEALPGLVMGYTGSEDKTGLLYGFDPAAGKIVWTQPVPRAPETAISAIKKQRYVFTKGPDGFIWASMSGVLARINPQTAEVLPVGKMEDNSIAFLDGDVYVGGSTKFRKLTGIPKVTAPK